MVSLFHRRSSSTYLQCFSFLFGVCLFMFAFIILSCFCSSFVFEIKDAHAMPDWKCLVVWRWIVCVVWYGALWYVMLGWGVCRVKNACGCLAGLMLLKPSVSLYSLSTQKKSCPPAKVFQRCFHHHIFQEKTKLCTTLA